MTRYTSAQIRTRAVEIVIEAGFGKRTIPVRLVDAAVVAQDRSIRKHNSEPELDDLAVDVANNIIFGEAYHNRFRRDARYGLNWLGNVSGQSEQLVIPSGKFPFQGREKRLSLQQADEPELAYESLPGGRVEVYKLIERWPTTLLIEMCLDRHNAKKITHHLWVEPIKNCPGDGCRAGFPLLPGNDSQWRMFSPLTQPINNYLGLCSNHGVIQYFDRWLLLAEQVENSICQGPRHMNLYYDSDLRSDVVEQEVRKVMTSSGRFKDWCD